MNTSSLRHLSLAIIAGLGLATVNVDAAPAAPRPFARIQEHLDALGVTPEQRERLRTVFQSHKATLAPLVRKMVTERGTLAEAVRQTPVNEDAIRAGSAKLNDTRTAIALALARLHAEAAAVLTPEQRDKAKALRLDREARRDGFLQRWLSAEGGRI